MKTSKLQKKFLNQMRQMGDVPWPERRYRYAPTLGSWDRKVIFTGQLCQRQVGEAEVKRGRLRRKQTIAVPCGGRLIANLGQGSRRRVYCEACRDRRTQMKAMKRIGDRLLRIGALTPKEQLKEERRSVRLLNKFRRTGAR
jgi:hypothetical protein